MLLEKDSVWLRNVGILGRFCGICGPVDQRAAKQEAHEGPRC